MIAVKEIPPELTYDIRHIVLRQGLPRESCYWDTDKLPGVFHLGGWVESRQTGVATFQPEPYPEEPDTPAYRLRGMAVLPEARGRGVGTLMLLAGTDRVKQMGIGLLWCDARIGAVDFYLRHGWERHGELFEIPTAGPHYRMIRAM
ncbi:MAG: GNAT family N-acetyltransferase [Oscillospiraceae bacterium]|jgi:GNAT superfamily N-acetyltransferase|nr:GNAT family N-acetyltransferase [Oscillospiraceae bacterium]